MTQDVQHCFIDEPMDSVLRRLRAANASFVAVCDAAGAIVGAVSERDFALEAARVSTRRASASRKAVEAIMSNDLVCCAPDDDLEVAWELMSRFGKSRVVCVDDSLRPIGSISGQEFFWKESTLWTESRRIHGSKDPGELLELSELRARQAPSTLS